MYKRRQYDDSQEQRGPKRPGYASADSEHDGRALLSMQDCDFRLRSFAQNRKQRGFVADRVFDADLADVMINLDRHVHNDHGASYIAWEESQGRDVSQSIAFHLYNLGILARDIKGRVRSTLVEFMLARLERSRSLNSKSISNAIYGLSLLAREGKIDERLNARVVQDLLDWLHKFQDVKAQNISNALYGLGLLAQTGLLDGQIASRSVQDLLGRLYKLKDVTAQELSSALYGLGLLAQAGLLEGQIASRSAQDLLDQLHALKDVDAQGISSALYGLGLLAQAGLLEGQMASRSAQDLLDRLHKFQDVKAQGLSNALYGLGLLAKAGLLEGQMASRSAQDLLDRLHKFQDVKAQGISNTLYALGLLAAAQKLKPSTDCVAMVVRLVPTALGLGVNAMDAKQLLLGLSELVPGGEIEGEQLRILFSHALDKSYLHPANAARLIHYLVVFRAHHVVLTDVFAQVSSSIHIPLPRFPEALQAQLKDDLRVLADVPQWRSDLSSKLGLPQRPARVEAAPRAVVARAPRPLEPVLRPAVMRPVIERPAPRPLQSALWVTTCRDNAVFAAIAAKDMPGLQRLFGMLQAKSAEQRLADGVRPRGAHHGAPRAGGHPIALPAAAPDVYVDNIATANALTTKFLKETPGLELQELIASSTFDYFELMLRACSHHTRYQLAIDNALHNILLHLPIKELQPMVASLIQQGFYRDHRALLALVDALSIRLFAHEGLPTKDRESIVTLRLQLFSHAIEHHTKANHHRVVPRLQAARERLESPNACLCLLDDEASSLRAMPSSDAPRVAVARPIMPAQASAEGLFARSAPRVLARQEPPINMGYEYTSEDIEAILNARLAAHRERLVILAAADESADPGNRVRDVLSNYLEHYDVNTLIGRKVLLPIHVGRHWVGVILEVGERRNVTMTYFNSLPNLEGDRARKERIAQQLREILVDGKRVFGQIVKRVCLGDVQQVDGTSCGALLVENLSCCIENARWPRDPGILSLTKKIRLRHLELLKRERPDYYPQFLAHQQGEELAASAMLG